MKFTAKKYLIFLIITCIALMMFTFGALISFKEFGTVFWGILFSGLYSIYNFYSNYNKLKSNNQT